MITLRVTEKILHMAVRDLSRPHQLAWERVGFLFFRSGRLNDGKFLLLGSEYMAVKDEDYIDDITVGARINSNPIRSALQKIMDGQVGCFHVHRHAHEGKPEFSDTDMQDLNLLIPSFQSVGKKSFHGAIIFSNDSACAVALYPEGKYLERVGEISIVGSPIRKFYE